MRLLPCWKAVAKVQLISFRKACLITAARRLIGEQMGEDSLTRFGKDEPIEPLFIGADVTRLTNEVQWKPGYILTEGLKRTIQWYAAQME